MKKLLVLIFIYSIFTACTPFSVEDNKRILIKGKIENTSSEGIEDIPIAIAVEATSGGYFTSSTSTEILQEYHTSRMEAFPLPVSILNMIPSSLLSTPSVWIRRASMNRLFL